MKKIKKETIEQSSDRHYHHHHHHHHHVIVLITQYSNAVTAKNLVSKYLGYTSRVH